jgi:glycosyltransferase involved in cell wall biosynthesis
MKILFVSPYFGYSGVVSDTLAGHLAKRGHEIILAGYVPNRTLPSFTDELQRFSKNNIRFQNANSLSISIPGFVTEFPFFLTFKQILTSVDPDIVHINCLPFLTTLQAARIAKKCSKKTLIQVHGVVGGRGSLFGLFQEIYNSTASKIALNTVDKVICLTNGDARKTVRYGCPPNKITIIPNGVDTSEYSPIGIEENDHMLLWCGRFIQQKGLDTLITAMKIVNEKDPKVKLIMTGDGPLLPKIYRQVQKSGLSNNVALLGRVPRKDIAVLMNRASVFVLPSLYEGMPYVLLEAMACGKPVIGTNISGINDIICNRYNGLIVPPKDSHRLSMAILELINEKQYRRKLGQNARNLMVEKYSWNAVTNLIEQAYYDISSS